MELPTYQPHRDREARLASATAAIRAILPLDLYPAHKKELISICLWKISEADGKYKLRFWSEGALAVDSGALRHEHVYERKELIARLLSVENISAVVQEAIACNVTEGEHGMLTKVEGSGWDRYRAAGIRVYDAEQEEWLEI